MKRIKTEGLSRIYGQGDTKVAALCDVNLDINPGEFTAFIGPSGSGKSTLLHLLGGLDQPSSGRIWVGDRDLYAMREKERAVFRRRNFGFVFQSFNLVPVLTAEENIVMPLLLDGQAPDPAWFKELTSMLGITDRLKHLPGQLSGGQQQRVAIARALVTRPPIVFADEPTGNLDTANGREVLNLLVQSVEAVKGTLVMITHDPNIAQKAHRVIAIVDGKLQQGGMHR